MTYRHNGADSDTLCGASASFEGGRLYAVVGRPGAGKTTLLMLLAGLDACGGAICFNGTNLNNMDRDEYRSRDIGAVFRSGNLIASATAVENVELSMEIGGYPSKDRKARAYALLEQAGVGREAADRKASKLTGALLQRAAVARALANDPRVIMADEPAGSLNDDDGAEIMRLLTSLAHDGGRCVIVATQQKKGCSNADEIWALAGGRLLLVR